MFPRSLEDDHKTYLEDVLKKFHEDFFKTSSALQFLVLQDVLKVSRRRFYCENFLFSKTSWLRFEDVLKTSWKSKNCHAEGVFKTYSGYVSKTFPRYLGNQQMLAGTRQKKYLHLEVLLQTKKRNKSKETIVRCCILYILTGLVTIILKCTINAGGMISTHVIGLWRENRLSK